MMNWSNMQQSQGNTLVPLEKRWLATHGDELTGLTSTLDKNLFIALTTNDHVSAAQFIEMGANVHYIDSRGWNYLQICSSYGFAESVKLLLNHIDPNQTTDKVRYLALYVAVMGAHIDCVSALLPVSDLSRKMNDNGISWEEWAFGLNGSEKILHSVRDRNIQEIKAMVRSFIEARDIQSTLDAGNDGKTDEKPKRRSKSL